MILALVAVAGIETALALRGAAPSSPGDALYGSHAVPSMEESVVQWQVTHALASDAPVDIVVIGDSSCLMGIRSGVIEEVTGLSAVNLGTVATLYSDGHADLLEEFIAQRGAPKFVVYHTAAIYGVGFYSADDIADIGLLRQYRLWRGLRPEGSAYRVPSIRRYRKSAQEALHALWVPREQREDFLLADRGPYPSDVDMKKMVEELNGGMIEPEQWDWSQVSPEAEHKLHYNKDVFPGLRRLVELAETYDFQLVIAFNPMPEAYRDPRFEETFAAYLADFQRELPPGNRLAYLEPALRYFSNDLCGTVCHLNDDGATENSKHIGQWLTDTYNLGDE